VNKICSVEIYQHEINKVLFYALTLLLREGNPRSKLFLSGVAVNQLAKENRNEPQTEGNTEC